MLTARRVMFKRRGRQIVATLCAKCLTIVSEEGSRCLYDPAHNKIVAGKPRLVMKHG